MSDEVMEALPSVRSHTYTLTNYLTLLEMLEAKVKEEEAFKDWTIADVEKALWAVS